MSGIEIWLALSQAAASWAAAAGTTTAAVVALWFGLSEERRRKKDRRLAAESLQIMMHAELSMVLSTARKLPELLTDIAANYFGDDNGQSAIASIRFAASRLNLPMAEKYFGHASYFKESDYKTIAALLGEMPKLKIGLNQWADRFGAFSSVKSELVESLKDRCNEIADAIDSVSWFQSGGVAPNEKRAGPGV